MRPETPTRSHRSSRATERIRSAGTITPEVDDLEPVALQHHPDDVLADVVHVALRGGEDDPARLAGEPPGGRPVAFAGRRLRLEPGGEVRDRPFHHAGGLDHLG